tara:strand:- start:9748 stop:10920 length:1173 start_codon:yes stop_codon:yes gene_type:complete
MGKSKAPPPPDYAAATREGVYADIETMPARRRIEAAYRLGQPVSYADPRTGKQVSADFRGLGDIDITEAETEALLGMVPQMTEAQLSNLIEYGPQFIAEQREQMRQVDPEGFGLREEFAGGLRRGEGTAEELLGEGVAVPEYEEVAAPTLAEAEMTSAGRQELETQLADQLMRGEQLTPEQQRMLEQGVRRASASRGQALGAGSGLREAIAKLEGGMQLGQQRRGEYLGFLGSGQSESDTANRLAQQNFANTMQRVQQINQARGATFTGQQQNLGQQLATRQQGVGNIQSLLGLAPVAAQGGMMAGFQQGASPFATPQMQRGMGLDPGAAAAGSGFASNVFGTQASMYEPSSPLGTIAGTVLGGLGGFGGQMLGARMALGPEWRDRVFPK